MKRHDLLVSLAMLILAPACGGKIATEEGASGSPLPRGGAPNASPSSPTVPAAPNEESPTLAVYCDALSTTQCGQPLCVSDAECRSSYTNASDAYLGGVVACRKSGGIGCGYPDPCVAEHVERMPATDAQRALAAAYCRACSPEADLAECQDAALRPEGGGESLSFALRVLGETNAERALECEANTRRDTGACDSAFITCLAKYRPIVSYTACR